MDDLQTHAIRQKSERRSGDVPVWAMHTLPRGVQIEVDIAPLTRIPRFALCAFRDADIRRQRFKRSERAIEVDKALYQRLATKAPAGRSLDTDPLFWRLRVGWYLRQAALPPAGVQCRYPASPEGSLSYRSMAARACGLLRVQRSDRQLCSRLLDESEGAGGLPCFSDNTASHWLLWSAAARGIPRETAWQAAYRAGVLGNRRSPLSTRQMVEEGLSGRLPPRWRFFRDDPEPYRKVYPELASRAGYIGIRLDEECET